MCIAANRAAAEDLTELVEVDYEELPAIASSAAGQAPGAVRLHDHWGDNLFLETAFDSGINTVAATAPVRVDLVLSCARQVMHPMEGRGLLAWWDYRAAQLVVHASTQVPHLIRAGLAEVLNVPQAAIRIAPPDIGGGFGYKCLMQPEDVAVAWLALTYKTPFRWIEDRRETSGRRRQRAPARLPNNGLCRPARPPAGTGRRDHGRHRRLLGLAFTACLEAAQAGGNLPGPYDLAAYRCRTYSVATNKPPFAPYRGVRAGRVFASRSN